jgi:hypothetical protein
VSLEEVNEGDQYVLFQPRSRPVNTYHNYAYRGPALLGMSLYEYTCQITVSRINESQKSHYKTPFYDFDSEHQNYGTHVQRSASCFDDLYTTCITGGFSNYENNTKKAHLNTKDSEKIVYQVLLGLFIPWHLIKAAFTEYGSDIDKYPTVEDTAPIVWQRLSAGLPAHLKFHAHNIRFLRRSKATAEKDRAQRKLVLEEQYTSREEDTKAIDTPPDDLDSELFGNHQFDSFLILQAAFDKLNEWRVHDGHPEFGDEISISTINIDNMAQPPIHASTKQIVNWKKQARLQHNRESLALSAPQQYRVYSGGDS